MVLQDLTGKRRVNDDWVIDVGTLDYVPMRDQHRMATVKKKDGTTVEEPVYGAALGYYTSLKNAVRAIAKAEYVDAEGKVGLIALMCK